jgi:hypothetical protein
VDIPAAATIDRADLLTSTSHHSCRQHETLLNIKRITAPRKRLTRRARGLSSGRTFRRDYWMVARSPSRVEGSEWGTCGTLTSTLNTLCGAAWRARFCRGAVRHRLGTWYGELGTAHLPDRVYLVRELIPAVGRCADKVLVIGCRPYTKHYPGLFGMHGAECWTIDIDPSAARWGAPGRRVTGAIQDSHTCAGHLPNQRMCSPSSRR